MAKGPSRIGGRLPNDTRLLQVTRRDTSLHLPWLAAEFTHREADDRVLEQTRAGGVGADHTLQLKVPTQRLADGLFDCTAIRHGFRSPAMDSRTEVNKKRISLNADWPRRGQGSPEERLSRADLIDDVRPSFNDDR
jgi:hypothetical protein